MNNSGELSLLEVRLDGCMKRPVKFFYCQKCHPPRGGTVYKIDLYKEDFAALGNMRWTPGLLNVVRSPNHLDGSW